MVIAVSGLLVAVITAAAGVAVAIVNSKGKSHPDSVLDPDDWAYVRERVAVLERRADDSDNRDEVQDRRLDHVEHVTGIENEDWTRRIH